MCIFTGQAHVSATKIFARMEAARQALVYSMSVEAKSPVAMILPLPTKQGTGFNELQFVNLEDYPDFFKDMEKGFPKPRSKSFGIDTSRGMDHLEVHDVGAFVASFVPTMADFERLDPMFRLPAAAVEYPGYDSYGFAVFQLKSGRRDIHPMAFWFQPRNPSTLFFPTVHVHDGRLPDREMFDHALYLQGHDAQRLVSSSPAVSFMNIEKAKGLIDPNEHVHKVIIRGQEKNEDTTFRLSAA